MILKSGMHFYKISFSFILHLSYYIKCAFLKQSLAHRILIIYLTLFIQGIGFGQYQFRKVEDHQKLSGSTIYCIGQDQLGYIWLGTSRGPLRFNGSKFELPRALKTSANTAVINLFIASNGVIWFGTYDHGLIAYDVKSENIKHFQSFPKDSTALISNRINHIFEDANNQIWICANGLHLYREATNSFKRIIPFQDEFELNKYHHWQNDFMASSQDPEFTDIMWIQSVFGLCRFNTNDHTSRYFFSKQNNYALSAAFFDSMGRLWQSFYNNTYSVFDLRKTNYIKEEKIFKDRHNKSKLPPDRFIELNNDAFLCAETTDGLSVLNAADGKLNLIADAFMTGTIQGSPTALFKDKNNRIWIGTAGQGLYLLQDDKGFSKKQLPGRIYQASNGKNPEWDYACSNESVLYAINNLKETIIKIKDPLEKTDPYDHIKDLGVDSKNNYWVISGDELYRFDDNTFTLVPSGVKNLIPGSLSYSYFWDFCIDANDNFWLSSQTGGIIRIDSNLKSSKVFNRNIKNPHSLFFDYSINQLYFQDPNAVWGTTANGFFLLNPRSEMFYNSDNPPVSPMDNKALLGRSRWVEDIHGKMYLLYDLNTIAQVTFFPSDSFSIEMIELKTKLPDGKISDASCDAQGNLWIGSDQGLSKINIQEKEAYHFGSLYGIGAIYGMSYSSDGIMYAGTDDAYFKFRPEEVQLDSSHPLPVISEIKVFDKNYLDSINPTYIHEIQLNQNQNFISIHPDAIDLYGNNDLEFAYMLRGLEANWNFSPEANSISYTNLEGGSYAFLLKVRRPNGKWSPELVISMEVIPPFWKTTWFKLLCLAGLIALVMLLYNSRINKIKGDEAVKTEFNKQMAQIEMKALRAQMNPHFLFNSLNAIKYYVLKENKEKASNYLTDFSRLIRLVLNHSSKHLISLREELESLELYIKIERLRFEEKFDYVIHTDDKTMLDEVMIPPLLLQPYVENAIWHGLMHKMEGKGILTVLIDHIEDSIRIIIEDNGIGRKKAEEVKSKSAQKHKSMGMRITQSRIHFSKLMSNLNLELEIFDLVDDGNKACGTRVVLHMKQKDVAGDPL